MLAPAAVAGQVLGAPGVWVFALSLVAILSLAKMLGDATESLAAQVGPTAGGLLNATLGNAAELIITLVALRAGLVDLVKASITGSILGNLLLVMGLALVAGGAKNGIQRFDRRRAGMGAVQMVLAVIALAVPTMFSEAIEPNHWAVTRLSDGVAVVMLLLYVLSLFYSFKGNPAPADGTPAPGRAWSRRRALAILAGSTAALAAVSEILVGAVEPAMAALGVSEFFIGIILVPVVGNAAEHMVAVTAAVRNDMELTMAVALGSSTQIALLVAPALVLLSIGLAPAPMVLVFNRFELAALVAATAVASIIAVDGESNWLEGAQLLAVYVILTIAFLVLPA